MAATAARPSCLDASTSGTGSNDMRASLIVSLATGGSPSSPANAGASVDFPLAGGPDTTRNSLLELAIVRCSPWSVTDRQPATAIRQRGPGEVVGERRQVDRREERVTVTYGQPGRTLAGRRGPDRAATLPARRRADGDESGCPPLPVGGRLMGHRTRPLAGPRFTRIVKILRCQRSVCGGELPVSGHAALPGGGRIRRVHGYRFW